MLFLQGIQYYYDVVDIDDPETDSDFVDAHLSDSMLRAEGGRVITARTYTGIHSTQQNIYSSITLSFEVVCLPGYVSEICIPICTTVNACSNGGTAPRVQRVPAGLHVPVRVTSLERPVTPPSMTAKMWTAMVTVCAWMELGPSLACVRRGTVGCYVIT